MSSWVARLPVPTLLGAAAVAGVAAVLALVLRPTPLPPLTMHLAQLGLAGAAAFLLDDPAAELTGVAPPPLWRRRAPRVVVGLTAVAAAWVVVLLASVGAPRGALSLEIGVLVVAALAASSVVASRGEPEPGTTVAPTVLLAGLAPVLVVGLLGRPVFLSDAGQVVPQGLTTGWVVAGVVAAVVLIVSCRDPAAGRRPGAAAGSRARRAG